LIFRLASILETSVPGDQRRRLGAKALLRFTIPIITDLHERPFGVSAGEEKDIVAFIETLNDGYYTPAPSPPGT